MNNEIYKLIRRHVLGERNAAAMSIRLYTTVHDRRRPDEGTDRMQRHEAPVLLRTMRRVSENGRAEDV
jgi:hypothetical protein